MMEVRPSIDYPMLFVELFVMEYPSVIHRQASNVVDSIILQVVSASNSDTPYPAHVLVVATNMTLLTSHGLDDGQKKAGTNSNCR